MKKRMFKLRRVAAGLLTAFLLAGEIGTGGLKAYAADDETEEVTEAAVEEEAAEEEELPAEEEEMPTEENADGRGEDLPDKSKISFFGKEVKSGAKGTGDSGSWIYKNGVLLLNNFRINTPFPGSSGIVAEGDLEIIVKGNCSFIMRSDDKASAIRTGGNLTITNGPASGTDTGVGKLVVVGNANGQGIGIDCGGDLTIAHVSAIKTLDFEEMIKEPSGILRGSLYVGAAGKKDSAILVKGNMNVLEANVVAEAGGKVTEGDSVAIAVGRKLRVDHSRIEATPGTSSKEEQKNLGIRAEEITLNTSHVAEPRMGKVDVFNGYSQVIQNGGSGWYNETAVIDPGKAYGLCVGGIQVTSENYSKLTKELETVLQGTDPSVTYDPILKTLTLENVEGFTGDSFFRRSYIYTETPIKLRGNASIDAPLNVQVMSAKCDGAIDIAGQFSFSSANYDTIWLGNDTPLVIDGDDTVLSVTINNEVEDENYAIMANGGFTMKDGSVTVEAPYEDGIYSLTGPIAILGGTLKAKGKTYALKSENGIELGEDVDILKPADGAKGTVTEGEKSYWTIKDGENVANDVELKSAVHALTSVTQADAVYGDPLPATVVLGGPDDVDPVFSYEGTLAKDGSAYGPATDKPTLPGHYRVTATKTKGEGEDQESWKGSDEFIIEARPVVAEVTAQDRVYTGDPMVKIATATLTNALTDDDVVLDLEETYGEMEDENAGENKTVKRLFNATLKGETASNYTIDPDQLLVGVTVNIAKADWTRKNVEQEVEAGQELKDEDLSWYLAEGGSFGSLSVKQGEAQLAEEPVLSGTALSLKMKEALSKENVIIEIPVTGGQNYNDYTVTVTLFPKRDHSPLDPVPAYLNSATELYLVKGQKFTLPEKEWTIPAKADKSVVSVNNKGLLKAKKPGTATIQNKEGSRTIKITVTQPTIEKKLKLEVGGDDKSAELKYDKENLDAFWISSNPDVATVDQEGNVHAEAKGSAKITAYVNGTAYKCSVSVSESAIAEERTLHLNTEGKKNVSIKGMTAWTGGTEGVATANKKTIKAGKKPGIAVFNTKVGEKTYKLYVIVEDPTLKPIDVEGIKLSQSGKNKYKYDLTIKAGTKTTLEFTAVKQSVVYKCTKPETAFVDENGNVSARAPGKAKFTAKINGKTVTVNVVVTP